MQNLAQLADSACTLRQKQEICCNVMGFTGLQMDAMHRYQASPTNKLVMKPQTFHSAVAIFLLLKYPHIRPKKSFVNIIIAQKVEDCFLKLATDILSQDVDGLDLIAHGDAMFCNPDQANVLVDDHNKTTFVV